MPMNYLSMTEDEQNILIAHAIHGRETEHFHYELNRKNYTDLLASPDIAALPANWPANLTQYRDLDRDKLIQTVTDPTTLKTVQDLQLRDKLRKSLAAETMERDRVSLYHGQLVTAIPTKVKLDKAIADAKIERAAAKLK